jgi:hypothetical protein
MLIPKRILGDAHRQVLPPPLRLVYFGCLRFRVLFAQLIVTYHMVWNNPSSATGQALTSARQPFKVTTPAANYAAPIYQEQRHPAVAPPTSN